MTRRPGELFYDDDLALISETLDYIRERLETRKEQWRQIG